jgi:hypothetical protein
MADPISTIKNISEFVEKYNDLPLMQQIVALQTEVFELQQENHSLKAALTQFKPYHYRGGR